MCAARGSDACVHHGEALAQQFARTGNGNGNGNGNNNVSSNPCNSKQLPSAVLGQLRGGLASMSRALHSAQAQEQERERDVPVVVDRPQDRAATTACRT